LIIAGKSKRTIEDHFDRPTELENELEKKNKQELLDDIIRNVSEMVDIHYIRQKDPKGLNHAIYCAKTFVGNEPFAVLWATIVFCKIKFPKNARFFPSTVLPYLAINVRVFQPPTGTGKGKQMAVVN